jgi:hypothetical protein
MRRIFAGLATLTAGGGLILAASGPASAAAVIPASVTYFQIANWHSGKCVDLAGASQQPGAVVQQFTCNGVIGQQWRTVPTDSGYFELVVAASGQCMTVDNASQADAAQVHQQPCNGAYNQQWTTQASGEAGWPFLVARHSGKGLTIGSESLLDRAPLVQYATGGDGPDTLHAGDWQFQ